MKLLVRIFPFLICTTAAFRCHHHKLLLSRCLRIATAASSDPSVSSLLLASSCRDDDEHNAVGEHNNKSYLTSRVLGFYPFPTSPPRRRGGPFLGWILNDTHQAIIVTEQQPTSEESSSSQQTAATRVRMDFMTKNGAGHPVWYDEATKWNVFFGGSIDGEVRIKILGSKRQRRTSSSANEEEESKDETTLLVVDGSNSKSASSKLERLIARADDYNCRMNLYSNNCRIFVARMEREVIRLNLEGTDNPPRQKLLLADIRCALRILWAVLLPSLYPLVIILLLYEGCFMAY